MAGRTSCWSMAWTGPDTNAQRSTLQLYRNNRNGTFTDVTQARARHGDVWHGRGRRRLQQRRLSGHLYYCVGQNRLFQNTGKGTFVDVTRSQRLCGPAGIQHFRVVVRFRSRWLLDLFVCNYVNGRRNTTFSAAWTASTNRIARRRHIAAKLAGCSTIGATGLLKMSPPRAASSTPARNRWASPCSITIRTAGPICWSPTILSLTSSIATCAMEHFRTWRVEAGIAFSAEGKARAGMGVDVGDFDNSGRARIADHQLR